MNIVTIHKKGDKQLKKNIDLSRYCLFLVKILKKIILNSLFKHLEDRSLLNNNQSGFRPGNSYVHQLLAITNDSHKVFDTNPSLEVRGVFLDLLKAFDRVWHKRLM